LKSLRDPTKKMSKSDVAGSRIELCDSADDIILKIKKSVTDSISKISYDCEGRPGVSNLIELHMASSGQSLNQILTFCDNNNIDSGKYKRIVSESLINYLKPISDEYHRLIKDKPYLIKLLNEGAEKANEIAQVNFKEISQLNGLNLNK
jgi:tryptophanyl-tRNA synthetase